MASVLVPVLYLGIVLGGLLAFSSFYRRRAAGMHCAPAMLTLLISRRRFHTAKLVDPYFPGHPARDTYITLLQSDPPVRDQVIKAALLARAVTDVSRVLQIREDKPALQALLQKGSVGDALWQALLAAERELEAEILDVVAEANSFVPGWGQIIFESATQVIANDKMRAMLESTPKMRLEAGLCFRLLWRLLLNPTQSLSTAQENGLNSRLCSLSFTWVLHRLVRYRLSTALRLSLLYPPLHLPSPRLRPLLRPRLRSRLLSAAWRLCPLIVQHLAMLRAPRLQKSVLSFERQQWLTPCLLLVG
jgi:translocation protein SEC66